MISRSHRATSKITLTTRITRQLASRSRTSSGSRTCRRAEVGKTSRSSCAFRVIKRSTRRGVGGRMYTADSAGMASVRPSLEDSTVSLAVGTGTRGAIAR